MLGHRVRQVDRKRLKDFSFAHLLIFLLYAMSMSFVLSAAVVKNGLGLANFRICRTAGFLCLTFYIMSKIVM